jgi:hypothetical protein
MLCVVVSVYSFRLLLASFKLKLWQQTKTTFLFSSNTTQLTMRQLLKAGVLADTCQTLPQSQSSFDHKMVHA